MSNGTYHATPLLIIGMAIGEDQAQRAIDALELHMRRHYGPMPGIVLDGQLKFVRLEKQEGEPE
jgi:hypothetical protein